MGDRSALRARCPHVARREGGAVVCYLRPQGLKLGEPSVRLAGDGPHRRTMVRDSRPQLLRALRPANICAENPPSDPATGSPDLEELPPFPDARPAPERGGPGR